jgi:hypothetical protein
MKKEGSLTTLSGIIVLLVLLYLFTLAVRYYNFWLFSPSQAMAYVFAPVFFLIFYYSGKFLARNNLIYFSIVLFGIVFCFGGIPGLYHPTWDASLHFKKKPENAIYLAHAPSVKEKIKSIDDSIVYENKEKFRVLGDYRRYKSAYDLRDYKALKKRIADLKKEKVDLTESLKNAIFIDSPEGAKYIEENTSKEYGLYKLEMVLSWLGLALLAFLGMALGSKRRGKEDERLDSIAKPIVGSLVLPIVLKDMLIGKVKGVPAFPSDEIRFSKDKGAYLTSNNLSLHTQVVGGSGVGKTNFLKHLILEKVHKGSGVLFLDFKADFEVMEWLAGVCKALNRSDLKVLTLSDPELSIAYNPLENGNSNELTSQLMNSLIWSEEYYRSYSENTLLMSFGLLTYLRDRFDKGFHIGHLLKLLTDSGYRYELLGLAIDYKHHSEVSKQLMELDLSKNSEKISGLVIQLKRLVFSEAGDIFTTNVENERSLNIGESLKNGEIVYLCMNSMNLKEVASLVGKMILQDLMKEVGSIYDSRERADQVSVVIDEFASFATPDFVHFIDKARGAGIELVLSHQSMADLREVSDNFGVRIFENTASKVIFNTLSGDDAEFFSSMIGTYQEEELTRQTENGFFGDRYTGAGSSRMVEKFTIHPNVFKSLARGQAVIATSKIDEHVATVKIDKAPEVEPYDVRFFPYKELKSSGRYLSLSFEVDEEVKLMSPASNTKDFLSDGLETI